MMGSLDELLTFLALVSVIYVSMSFRCYKIVDNNVDTLDERITENIW